MMVLIGFLGYVISNLTDSSDYNSKIVKTCTAPQLVVRARNLRAKSFRANERYGEATKQRLDRAVLIFFHHFRKSYIGDQAMHSSKLYVRLSELLGPHDHLLILNVIVGKIATNLKCSAASEEVINHTLGLFSEMATGFMTGKLLLKLDTVQCIISLHNVLGGLKYFRSANVLHREFLDVSCLDLDESCFHLQNSVFRVCCRASGLFVCPCLFFFLLMLRPDLLHATDGLVPRYSLDPLLLVVVLMQMMKRCRTFN